MKRKVYYDLLEWKKKSNGKTAMLIEGARCVGKSFIALEFAKNNYKNYVLINFSKVSEDVKNIFNNYLDKLDDFFAPFLLLWCRTLPIYMTMLL